METLILALLAGSGLTFTVIRALPFRLVMRHNILIDMVFTVGLPALFAGSYNGMVLAVLSGITMSIQLALIKLCTPKHIYKSHSSQVKSSQRKAMPA